MPRDSGGTYTLPSGNPVVTATTIDSSWANDTMDDIATVLTDSLSRSGDGGMLVAMEFASGLVGAPGITWTSEPTSGFYLAATNDMRASIAGVDRARFRADSANPFQIWNTVAGAWADVMNLAGDYTITGDWVFPNDTVIGGVTASNLVDKAADETITGDWTIDGSLLFITPDADVENGFRISVSSDFTIIRPRDAAGTTWNTAADFGYDSAVEQWFFDADIEFSAGPVTFGTASVTLAGIENQNLVDKTAVEVLTGMWTLDGDHTEVGFGTGGKVKDGGDTAQPIGFNVMPVYEHDSADTFDLAHNGMYWHKDAGVAQATTLDDDSDIPQGATFVLANEFTTDITITEGAGVTIKWFNGDGAAPAEGNLVLTRSGVATIYKYSDTEYHVWGTGLS